MAAEAGGLPLLALTSGEPAGVGPDLCLSLAASLPAAPIARLVILGDRTLLEDRARLLGLSADFPDFVPGGDNAGVTLLHVPLARAAQPGRLDSANARYVLALLDRALEGCLGNEFAALVTAPVHKAVINEAGVPFTGHTEYLQEAAGVAQVVMMLAGDTPQGMLRVALATTHLPLSKVPAALSPGLLDRTLAILHQDLRDHFGIACPHIRVAGLNPHAGEAGHLGHEDTDIIAPAVRRAREAGIDCLGPLPADTLFSPEAVSVTDAFLAMYHDQGLPVLKYATFGEGVNITLGLPFIRTSVDHGTALDLAGTGRARDGSLRAALGQAAMLARQARLRPPAH